MTGQWPFIPGVFIEVSRQQALQSSFAVQMELTIDQPRHQCVISNVFSTARKQKHDTRLFGCIGGVSRTLKIDGLLNAAGLWIVYQCFVLGGESLCWWGHGGQLPPGEPKIHLVLMALKGCLGDETVLFSLSKCEK